MNFLKFIIDQNNRLIAYIITAVPMHLSRFFRLKPIIRWVSRRAKSYIPYIPYRSLLLSTIVLNDSYKFKIVNFKKGNRDPEEVTKQGEDIVSVANS